MIIVFLPKFVPIKRVPNSSIVNSSKLIFVITFTGKLESEMRNSIAILLVAAAVIMIAR